MDQGRSRAEQALQAAVGVEKGRVQLEVEKMLASAACGLANPDPQTR
jgi:hypothetical protein